MGTSLRLAAIVAIIVAASLTSTALFAGPVTFGDGSIAINYVGIDKDDGKTFPVVAPGAKTETYDGMYDIGGSGFITTRGHSDSTYDIKDRSDGADMNVSIFHSNKGGDGGTLGGSVDFALNFTTDRPLHYKFDINPAGASHFEANLDAIHEFLDIDVLGTASGSLITEGSPTPKTLQGTLAAGSHAVSIDLSVNNGREESGGSTGGSFALSLDEKAGTAIPLPASGWTGAVALVVAGIALRARRMLHLN